MSSCKLIDKEGANGYNLPDIVQEIAKHFTTWKKPTSQAMLFCKLKTHTEDARKALQKLGYSALAYTSDSTNRDEVKQWFGQGHVAPDSGGKAFLCCTSGLGAGINMPNIDFVYFLGTPWDLFEVIQGGGRGGRLGSQFMVTVFPGGFGPSVHYDPQGKSLRQKWMDHKQCRRITLSSYMDGETLTCQSIKKPLCDLCEGRIPKKRVFDSLLSDDTEGSQQPEDFPPRIQVISTQWYQELEESHRLFEKLRKAAPGEQDFLVAQNQIGIWQDFSSALKHLIPKICFTKEELEMSNAPPYCPLCAGLGQLRYHFTEDCQKVPLDGIDDWLDAFQNLKSGVCKVCWLPVYHLDDGMFHHNVEREACQFKEPVPFVPYFLYSLVWYFSNEKGKQTGFWEDTCVKEMIPEVLLNGGLMTRRLQQKGLLEWFSFGMNAYAVPMGWKVLVHCLVILLGDDWEMRKINRRQNVELLPD